MIQYKNSLTYLLYAMLILLHTIFLACVSRNVLYIETDEFVAEQNFTAARQEIEANKEELYPPEDSILYFLDDGMLAFYNKTNKDSLKQLSIADRLMDDAFTKSISQEALSFLLNDTVQQYAGEDHERIFTQIFLALNYLQNNDFDGGFVEIKRTLNSIQKIQNNNTIFYDSYNQSEDSYISLDEYKTPIIDSAFVRLLSSWMYRADRDISNYEVALRNYNNAIQTQPHLYPFTPPEYLPKQGEVLFNQYTQNPSTQIVAFTGRSPIKVESGFEVIAADQVAHIRTYDETITDDGYTISQSNDSTTLTSAIRVPNGIVFSTRFSLPYLAYYSPTVESIEIFIDDTYIGNLSKTEDLARIILAVFEAKRDFIYAKTISRVITKSLLSALATPQAQKSGGSTVAAITSLAGSLFTNLSEKADLRSARYYPATIWTGDFLLPDYNNEKEYTVVLRYLNNEGDAIHQDTITRTLGTQLNSLNLITSTYLR